MKPGKIALLAAVLLLMGAGSFLSSREKRSESGDETLAYVDAANDSEKTANAFAATQVVAAGPITVYAAPT
jgi:hypothetical protein